MAIDPMHGGSAGPNAAGPDPNTPGGAEQIAQQAAWNNALTSGTTPYWQQWIQRNGGTRYFTGMSPTDAAGQLHWLMKTYPNGLPSGSSIGTNGDVHWDNRAADIRDAALFLGGSAIGAGALGSFGGAGGAAAGGGVDAVGLPTSATLTSVGTAPATAGFTGLGAGASGSLGGSSTAPAVTGGAASTVPVSRVLISQGTGQVIAGGLGAGAQIYGAKKQSQANADALKAQTDATNKALAVAKEQQQYQRTQYANYLTRMQPYDAIGQQAVTRLQDVLGAPGAIPSVRNA